ncbi:unnamed protein product, partial [Choristocarpus tenellus]
SFWEPGIVPEVQRMRHEAYSQRRHEMMRLCRQERKKLINAEHKQNSISHSAGSLLTPAQLLDQQQRANATMIENEERRMEKMRLRQARHTDK